MKAILSVLIFIFLITGSYPRDIRRVNRTAGLKEFKIGMRLNKILESLSRNKIKISDGDIYNREIQVDPYKLIKENIHKRYKNSIKDNAIVITVKTRDYNHQLNTLSKEKEIDYFIDLFDTTIHTKNFLFFNRDRKYRFQYKRIKDILITKFKAKNINPLLTRVSFHFVYDTLYRIRYNAKLNLDEISRLIKNYKARFRITKIGNGINIFYQKPYYYTLKMPGNIEKLLNRIHALREDEKKFQDHEIFMDMYNVDLVKRVRLYKARCYENFVNRIVSNTIARISRTRKAILTKLKENATLRTGEDSYKHSNVDDL